MTKRDKDIMTSLTTCLARLASLHSKKQVGSVLVEGQYKPSPLIDMLQGMDYVNITLCEHQLRKFLLFWMCNVAI